MKAGEAKAVCAALGTVLRQIDLAYKHGKSKGQAIPVLQISA
jgi:hypothetical protein